MPKLNPELIQYIVDNLQVGDRSPVAKVQIYRKKGDGQYESVPFDMTNTISLDVDSRWNMAADEANISFQNINGIYSPDYSHLKKYQGVTELSPSGYSGVVRPYNKVEISLGYGEQLIEKFSGQIQPIEIDEENPIISISCLNEYRKLLKSIDPIITRRLVYKNQKATDIITDLCLKAGCKTIIIDSDTVGGFDYSINQVTFELGTTYTDAINTILSTMGHRIFADRNGAIRVKKLESYTQSDANLWTFSDFVNITSGKYKIDPGVIRNRIIIQSKSSWGAYEDPYLIDYCNGERIPMGIQVPWAETDEQKLAVANGLFIQMRRKLRRVTIATVGNPGIDIGDLVKLEMLNSAVNGKYMVVGIHSTFTETGYFDLLDLEFVTGDGLQIAVKAEGNYTPAESDQTNAKRQKIIDVALKYIGTFYQHGGDAYHDPSNYGFDNSHFVYAVFDQVAIQGAYKTIEQLHQWTEPIPKGELQIGDLVFYINQQNQISHVVIYAGNNMVIGAIGGLSTITTKAEAQKRQAMVKIQPMDYNGRPKLYGRVAV